MTSGLDSDLMPASYDGLRYVASGFRGQRKFQSVKSPHGCYRCVDDSTAPRRPCLDMLVDGYCHNVIGRVVPNAPRTWFDNHLTRDYSAVTMSSNYRWHPSSQS